MPGDGLALAEAHVLRPPLLRRHPLQLLGPATPVSRLGGSVPQQPEAVHQQLRLLLHHVEGEVPPDGGHQAGQLGLP